MTKLMENKQLFDEFEMLLNQQFEKSPDVAQVVEGCILKRENDGYLVDIGAKTEAFLPDKEITNNSDADPSTLLEIGSKHDVYILKISDNDDEQILVSLKRVECAQVWAALTEAKANNDTIRTKVISSVKGGVIVDVMDLKGFIPSSHLRMGAPFDGLVGTEIEAKVLEADPKRNKLILSQRMAVVEQREAAVSEVLEHLAVDEIINGEVIRLADFGAFIDINGVDGLLPISEISWERINHPSDVLKLGEKIDVKILKIDYDLKRISLTLKRMTENPWEEIKQQFSEGQKIQGTINKVTSFGAFVNIFPGVEALLPSSEMVGENVNPFDLYKSGDVIDVVIKKFTPDEHRIALSVKELNLENTPLERKEEEKTLEDKEEE